MFAKSVSEVTCENSNVIDFSLEISFYFLLLEYDLTNQHVYAVCIYHHITCSKFTLMYT